MKSKLLNNTIVNLEWIDSHRGFNGWGTDVKAPRLECFTSGFLIAEDSKTVTVSSTANTYGAFVSPITIPKVAITKRQDFKFSIKGKRK